MNENNKLVLETLESLKDNKAFVTMLEFGVIELRCETYRDLDAPNEFEQQKIYDNLKSSIFVMIKNLMWFALWMVVITNV